AAKGDQLAMLVVDGDDDPLPKPVPELAAAVGPDRQARLDQLAIRDPVLAKEADQIVLALAGRREAKLEFRHRRPRDTAGLQLDQRSLPGLVLEQDVMKVLGRQQVQSLDGAFELTLPAGAGRLLEDHPGLVGQQPQGAFEVDVLDVLDEGEMVAALLAAIAMPELFFRRYI